ncbi:protease inhibitor I42 family protein [Pendulispora albinea]|uniref:Protease inhibitor I42 family protein n=1 Tax=Pendulispora albinea TaxID=2741071 RepID=A0ABZ2LU36_9BACT
MTPQTVTAAAGEEFAVRVESNPTTGYVWKVHALPDGVELLSSEYEHEVGPGHPGRPGTQIFRFRALEPGEHAIDLTLERPWEAKAIDSLAVTVKVI